MYISYKINNSIFLVNFIKTVFLIDFWEKINSPNSGNRKKIKNFFQIVEIFYFVLPNY